MSDAFGISFATFRSAAALEDPNTGVVSWESGAVMNYIRRVYDKENKLGPRGSTEQDIVDFEKWEYFLLTTLGPFTGQTNWVSFSPFILHAYLANEDDHLTYPFTSIVPSLPCN